MPTYPQWILLEFTMKYGVEADDTYQKRPFCLSSSLVIKILVFLGPDQNSPRNNVKSVASGGLICEYNMNKSSSRLVEKSGKL